MSRAFVKESDESARGEELPERPQSPHANYVTPAGLAQLQAQVAELSRRRTALLDVEDLAGRQELGVIERDLRYADERLRRAIVVRPDPGPIDRVIFGTTVEVIDDAGGIGRFSIVGEDEADVASGKISYVSPLATALLNARIGDAVIWRRPSGDKELEVAGIHR